MFTLFIKNSSCIPTCSFWTRHKKLVKKILILRIEKDLDSKRYGKNTDDFQMRNKQTKKQILMYIENMQIYIDISFVCLDLVRQKSFT